MQTSPYHPAFVSYRGGGLGDLRGFGSLGVVSPQSSGNVVASKAAGAAAGSVAGGAGGVVSYAALGSVAGPVGAVVGLVVGIVVTKLLTKNYLNVGQMNAAEAAEIAAFNQYRTIAGQAPGRQFGLAAMRAVWKGALHSGFFPKNQQLQCFHEGCSAHPGNAQLIDMVIDGGCGDKNCFPDMLPQFLARVQSAPAVMRTPTQPVMGRQTLYAPRGGGGRVMGLAGLRGFRGFGSLGQTGFPGTPEAVVFIDSFFIPANSSGAHCGGAPADCYWAAPQNATEHQILYDVADAYLAEQSFPSTPFVAVQSALTSQQAPSAILPAGSRTCTPFPPGSAMPAIACATMKDPATGIVYNTGPCREGGCGIYGVAAGSPVNPVLNPIATPQLPITPPAVAVGTGVVTTGNAATGANLDAALRASGYIRLGTNQDGYPIYQATPACGAVLNQACPPGATFVYANGQLYPYATAAQVAVTGSAGTGITTPAGGLDPATAALIANMMAQGATPAQAANGAAYNLAASGVPITPDVTAQLNAHAASTAGISSVTPGMWALMGLGLAFALARPGSRPSTKGPIA